MPRTDYATGPTPLPCLSEPSGRQRMMWGIAVTGALVLLGALASRLGSNVELLQWWVPVALVIGVALADLSSGLVHWSADTWGRADLPIIGPRVLVPFRSVGAWLTPGSQVLQVAASLTRDRVRLRPAKRGHLVQDAARKARLDIPATDTTGAKAVSNDGLVAEKGVLDAGLPGGSPRPSSIVAARVFPHQ